QVQAAAAEAPKAMAPKQAPPPAEPPKQAAPAVSSPPPESGAGDKAVTVEAKRDSDGLRVTFSFAAPNAAPSSAMSAGCRSKRARPSASASIGRRFLHSKAKAAPTAPSGR